MADRFSPLYLHLLDRELREAIALRLTGDILADALATGLMASTAPLYAGVSLFWESYPEMSDARGVLSLLLERRHLELISHHASMEDFIESRRALYYHDRGRYPMYFEQGLVNTIRREPTQYKSRATTTSLDIALRHWAVNARAESNAANDSLRDVEAVLQRRGTRAITAAMFKQEQLSADVVRALSFEISRQYTRHYLDYAAGDLITGLPGLSYFDDLARDFPVYDAVLLSEFYENLGIRPRRVRRRDIIEAASVRGSEDHRRFLTASRTALRAIVKASAPSPSLFSQREAIRAIVGSIAGHQRKGTGADIRARLQYATVTIAAGMRRLANRDMSFARALESEQTEANMFEIVIVTATELESRECLAAAKKATGSDHQRFFIGNNVYLDLGLLACGRIALVESEAGSGGPGGSILTISNAIRDLKPHAVILAGIAFGMSADKQRIGDVLISSRLAAYELQRVGTGPDGTVRIIERGDRPHADAVLLSAFRSARLDWSGKTRFGLLLSGDKLVANSEFRDALREFEPEAVGGEMEGAGLYAAADRARARWIVVKAICDWADHLKDDDNQQLAAERAMSFVFHTLRQGGVG